VGAGLAGLNSVSFQDGLFHFTYSTGGQIMTEYVVDTNNLGVKKGLLHIQETRTNTIPVTEGGTRYRKLDNSLISPAQLAKSGTVIFQHQLWPNQVVSLNFVEMLDGKTTEKRYDLEIKGKTLVVHAYAIDPEPSASGNYSGFSFGRSGQTPNPREVIIPYMEGQPIVMAGPLDSRFFYSTYIDWTRSNSNTVQGREGPVAHSSSSFSSSYFSQYIPAQGGIYSPLDETAYITVSSEVTEVMLKVNRKPSPFRADLNERVVWDLWGESLVADVDPYYAKTYDIARGIVKKLHGFGMDKLATIFHPWQYLAGISECGLPVHYPANPTYGSEEEFREFISASLGFGYLFALHENYTDIYTNSGEYWADGQNVARDPTGRFLGEFPRAHGCPDSPVSYNTAADKMAFYAAQESPKIKENYKTNASFLDVTTAIQPDFFIDYSAANPHARTVKEGLGHAMRLDAQQQSLYQGPLFGEGNASLTHSSAYQAGYVDGIEAEIVGREFTPIIPDFELRVIKPLQANQGMGYPGRWIGDGVAQLKGLRVTTFPWDKYRATQIAYGHTGVLQDATLTVPLPTFGTTIDDYYKYWTKEFYTFRELQWQYLGYDARDILYRIANNKLVPLSQALAADLDFYNAQIYVAYSSGLELYINRHQTNLWTVDVLGKAFVLPPNGWVAANSAADFLEYSALVDANGNPSATGTRVDYVRSPNYIMVDGRGSRTPIHFGGDFFGNPIITARFMVVKSNGWTLMEQADGKLQTSVLSVGPAGS
jgi:hypothetical protein